MSVLLHFVFSSSIVGPAMAAYRSKLCVGKLNRDFCYIRCSCLVIGFNGHFFSMCVTDPVKPAVYDEEYSTKIIHQ